MLAIGDCPVARFLDKPSLVQLLLVQGCGHPLSSPHPAPQGEALEDMLGAGVRDKSWEFCSGENLPRRSGAAEILRWTDCTGQPDSFRLWELCRTRSTSIHAHRHVHTGTGTGTCGCIHLQPAFPHTLGHEAAAFVLSFREGKGQFLFCSETAEKE